MPIWLPNTAGRVRAVKLHDLHHVLTEYPTTWRGEAEISAWEIGAGCPRKYYAAWFLDLMTIAQGMVVNPLGVYRGFMRGRSNSNLYSLDFTDEMLTRQVGEYRHLLRLDHAPHSVTRRDQLAFVFWVTASAVIYLIAVSPIWLTLALIVWWILWR